MGQDPKWGGRGVSPTWETILGGWNSLQSTPRGLNVIALAYTARAVVILGESKW